jgi:hypothetical protein
MQTMRYEIKMTCDEIHLPDARAWINLHPDLFSEAYPPRRVNSLYFDTYDLDSLNDNLIGSGQRQKLRLRWYGADYTAVRGVLELKCKSNQLGWKEHCPIPSTLDLTTTSWRAIIQQLRAQANDLFRIWLSYTDRALLINNYWREYYESIDRQVRVTLDYDQAAFEQITYLRPNLTVKSPVPSLIVVEVKSDATLHRRVSNVLSLFPLQVARNSKYVNGVTESLCFL